MSFLNFYPRPPRGGRLTYTIRNVEGVEFLSTPSARRATRGSAAGAPPLAISIHALREEGDFYITEDVSLKSGISIHALREEGDDMIYQFTTTYAKFLSTPSARRATGPYEEDKKDFHLFLSTPSARRATIE